MCLLYVLLVALLALFVADKGLPLLHHEDHSVTRAAPADLSFPASLGSSSFAEVSFPSSPGFSSPAIQVQAKRLAGMGYHFLVLQSDNTVFATGLDGYGQLGTSTAGNAITPQKASVSGVVDVAAGAAFSCLVVGITDRQVQCVGDGGYGQLGRGSTDSSAVLQPVSGPLEGVSEVFCGYYTTFAVKLQSGQVYAWGYNIYSGLGIGSSDHVKAVPTLVSLPVNFHTTQVGTGDFHSCFLSSMGEVRCAGINSLGRLGDGGSVNSAIPVAVDLSSLPSPETTKFVSLAAGDSHTCATATDNKVFCWGSNGLFQLGTNEISDQNKPTPVAGITNARSVWASFFTTFVIDNNPLGSGAVAFGRDAYGVFGIGTLTTQTASPLGYGQNVTGIVELRGGYKVTCILKQSGEVWCTGQQDFGQFGRGNKDPSLVLVQMQDFPTLAPTPPTTWQPTLAPTTLAPTTLVPTHTPTKQPTHAPTTPTTKKPTKRPTSAPSAWPTSKPTKAPTIKPTKNPTKAPSKYPTKGPTVKPTKKPTKAPTQKPTTKYPTKFPTKAPTSKPTVATG